MSSSLTLQQRMRASDTPHRSKPLNKQPDWQTERTPPVDYQSIMNGLDERFGNWDRLVEMRGEDGNKMADGNLEEGMSKLDEEIEYWEKMDTESTDQVRD